MNPGLLAPSRPHHSGQQAGSVPLVSHAPGLCPPCPCPSFCGLELSCREGQPSQQSGVPPLSYHHLEFIRNGKGTWEGDLSRLSSVPGQLPSQSLLSVPGCWLPRQEATVPPLLVSREQGHTQSPVCLHHLLGPEVFVTEAMCVCVRPVLALLG